MSRFPRRKTVPPSHTRLFDRNGGHPDVHRSDMRTLDTQMSTVQAETVDILSPIGGHFARNTGHPDVHLPDLLHQIIYQRGLRKVTNSLAELSISSPLTEIHQGSAVCGRRRARQPPRTVVALRRAPLRRLRERTAQQRRHGPPAEHHTRTEAHGHTVATWAHPWCRIGPFVALRGDQGAIRSATCPPARTRQTLYRAPQSSMTRYCRGPHSAGLEVMATSSVRSP